MRICGSASLGAFFLYVVCLCVLRAVSSRAQGICSEASQLQEAEKGLERQTREFIDQKKERNDA